VGSPSGQAYTTELYKQRIVLVPRVPGMLDGRRTGVAAIQCSCRFIRCSSTWTETTRCGVANNGKKSSNVEPRGKRCSSSKDISQQGLTLKQSGTFFAFAIRWGVKVRNPTGEKSKMQSWENFGHKLDTTYWQANKVF